MSYFLKDPTHSIVKLGIVGALIMLASCGGLTSNKKGVTSPVASKANSNLDVLNSSSNHTIRMSWEGAIEESKVLSGYSVEADKRGDLGVYCFANETSCRQAASEIRNAVVGGKAYRDNPVAIQALELRFGVAVSNVEISLVMATPVMKATTSSIDTASRAELWFKDMNVLQYNYTNGTETLTKTAGSALTCGADGFGFVPPITQTYTVVPSGGGSSYDIFRGPRVLTGFGIADHGTKQTGTSSNIYYYGRLGYALIYHLGLAPSATGSKFNPTFIPTAISTGASTTAPAVTAGEGSSNPVHKVGWNFYPGAKPNNYHQQLIVGMCIKGTASDDTITRHPVLGAFFRTNLFMLKDCDMESCSSADAVMK